MNNVLKTSIVLAISLYAAYVQAYTFGFINNTTRDHQVELYLKGFAEPVENLGVATANGGVVERTFTGLRGGLCIEWVKVDGKNCDIFEVAPVDYDVLVQMSARGNIKGVRDHFEYNRNRFNFASASPFGVCFSRAFAIIDVGNNEVILITKRIL